MLSALIGAVGALSGALSIVLVDRLAPRFARSRHPVPSIVAAAVAGALALAGSAAPTGLPLIDAVERVLFVAVLTMAASRARRWTLLVAAGAAAAATQPDALSLALAFAALAAAVVLARRPRRSRLLGAMTGAVTAHALLRLGWPDGHGATAALAAAAVLLVGASAVARLHRRERRLVLAGMATVLLLSFGLGAAAAASLAGRRDDATAAVEAATAGLAAARRGESEVAAERLRAAGTTLKSLDRQARRWWLTPLCAVPVVSQQVAAGRTLLAAAIDAADAGAQTAAALNLDHVRPIDGRVDLAALASFEQPLDSAARTLRRARERLDAEPSRWLVSPIQSRTAELRDKIDAALRDLETARDSTQWVPRLLGADGPTRWFVAMLSPAELRNGGGFIGSWAILTADHGQFELSEVERAWSFARSTPYRIDVSPEYDAWYPSRWHFSDYPVNLTASPDFPSSAEAIADVAEQAGLGRVDGVLALDPVAIASLIRLTGPLEVDWLNEPLTAENAEEMLLHGQYLRALDPERRDFLQDVATSVFDRLTSGTLSSPSGIADVLGPLVASKHVQLHAFDPGGQAFLERRGVQDALVPPFIDAIAVSASDATPSKLDWFLRRRVTYDLTVDPRTGAAHGTVTVRYRNEAPRDLPDNGYFGDPSTTRLPVGTSVVTSTLHTPLRVGVLTIDGEPIGRSTYSELGYQATEAVVTLPPGGEKTVTYAVSGTLPATARYQLRVHRQPMVAADDLVVRVNGATLFDGPQDRDLLLTARLR